VTAIAPPIPHKAATLFWPQAPASWRRIPSSLSDGVAHRVGGDLQKRFLSPSFAASAVQRACYR